MASMPSWSKNPLPWAGRKVPPVRRLAIKAVVSLLIFLGLVFIKQTTGRTAGMVNRNIHHWISASVPVGRYWAGIHRVIFRYTGYSLDIPNMVKTGFQLPISSTKNPLPQKSASPAGSAWLPIVSRAQTVTPFGWASQGRSATFHQGITLRVPFHQLIRAGVSGSVSQVQRGGGGTMIAVRVNSRLEVRYQGLANSRVRVSQGLSPQSIIGQAGRSPIKVSILDRGYPVNPLSRQFFGSSWVTP